MSPLGRKRIESPAGTTLDTDIVVIGGGVAGAAIARDAALRGVRVRLFEKNAFGSGASSKSSKLIHGGIRYLEIAWNNLKQGDFDGFWRNLCFVFSALRESGILARIAPSCVSPHPIFIPIYASDRRSKMVIFLGTAFYSLLSLLAGNPKNASFYFSAEGVLKILPELNPDGLTGGVTIWDHLTDDLALVQKIIASAREHGAVCEEHAEVLAYHHDREENVYEVTVKTAAAQRTVRCRKLINAGGAWVDKVRERGKEHEKDFILPVAGSHVEVRPFLTRSVLLQAADGRFFFVISRAHSSRIGTTERLIKDPDRVEATKEEIDYLLGSVTRYFPGVRLSKKDVLSTDAGVRPLAAPKFHKEPNQVSREHEVRVGPSGVVHVLGVKLTDHRRAAQEVLDRLMPSLLPYNPKAKRKTSTHKVPL